MDILLRSLAITAGVVVALVLLGYVGLQVRPKSFAAYPEHAKVPATVPLPADLPAPVERYFKTTVGDRIPVIESAVLTGRGYIRLNGLRFPARFRFTHEAGQGYRHYIETTVFGFPLMKVNEWYLDGHARMELPVGVIENDPKTDMAANLGLWGESMFLPSIYLTDPRVRWEPIDDNHARLIVPYGEGSDEFTVTFDVGTGLLESMEAMRWKAPTSPAKTLWRNEVRDWKKVGDLLLPTSFAVVWQDDSGPWFAGELEDVVYNVDVKEYIRSSGP
ncbi:MAG: DUF6544 family protein [Bacillota bacterium]